MNEGLVSEDAMKDQKKPIAINLHPEACQSGSQYVRPAHRQAKLVTLLY